MSQHCIGLILRKDCDGLIWFCRRRGQCPETPKLDGIVVPRVRPCPLPHFLARFTRRGGFLLRRFACRAVPFLLYTRSPMLTYCNHVKRDFPGSAEGIHSSKIGLKIFFVFRVEGVELVPRGVAVAFSLVCVLHGANDNPILILFTYLRTRCSPYPYP